MNYHTNLPGSAKAGLIITLTILIALGLVIFSSLRLAAFSPLAGREVVPAASRALEPSPGPVTRAPMAQPTQAIIRLPTLTPTRSEPTHPTTPTLTPTPSPTRPTPTPSVTPTPTRDLAKCNAAGCGSLALPLPTMAYNDNLLLTETTPRRRLCPECPQNEYFSQVELDRLVGADEATLAKLRDIALSQQAYQLAPGIVYLVSDYVHYVIVDLKESGFRLRNIIPPISDPSARESIRITPSYCLHPESLVVMTADYHGLVSSNKTETGRDIFFHLGRASLFQRNGRYDIDVIRTRSAYDRTTTSWGAGPIFIWNGEFNYNPEQEWFTPEDLEHYRDARWAKVNAALSQDRRYLFLSASYGLTLEEYAEKLITLGQRWGIKIDRAMIFDGNESSYLAIRLGDYMVPVLGIEEPLIVNCLALEREN